MTSSFNIRGNGTHVEEVGVDKSYVPSSQVIEEEKDKSNQKRKKSKSRGLRHILKREEKDNVVEKSQRQNDEKKSESLARTLSGIFSNKSKSEKEKRKDSKNRLSTVFFSDNEDETTDHVRKNKRSNNNDTLFSDNENGSNKKNSKKNRISLNIDKLLEFDDDYKHKTFNNNNMTDMFLPETNGTPIKTYKGRLDSSGSVSGRDSPVSILKRTTAIPNQTESPILLSATFVPFAPIINESSHEHSQEIKVESVEHIEQKDEIKVDPVDQKIDQKEVIDPAEQKEKINIDPVEQKDEINIELIEQKDGHKVEIESVEQKNESKIESFEQNDEPVEQKDEFKDNLNYSSTPATSINEDISVNENVLKLSSQVSYDNLNADTGSYQQVNAEIYNNADTEVNDIINSETTNYDDFHDKLEEDNIEHYNIENKNFESPQIIIEKQVIITKENILKLEEHHYIENKIFESPQIISPTPQFIEKQVIITRDKSSKSQQIAKLTSLESINESLTNVKDQLESKVQEQSQQIGKFTSLESVMVRQFEHAERMEETMRRLEAKRPTAGQELIPKVLKWATEDVDNPD
ncbi:8346_t:CDS:2 [Scutellospora calospora]|uniref:8346_t:CDS:1 n=1 Tax=Scutellospora calospora TaxID=85575 RepID=A0ACA9JU48_9GLOM|nr:8346_t:CDS:2 [Scutellospora calospora]